MNENSAAWKVLTQIWTKYETSLAIFVFCVIPEKFEEEVGMVLLSILKMESAGFQWMDWSVSLFHMQMQKYNESMSGRGNLGIFLPWFLTFLCFGTYVLEMNLLVVQGSPMPSGEYTCTWNNVQGIRRGDLNNCHTQTVVSFPRLRSGLRGFSCSSVLSFCWNECNHLLFLYYGRMWHLNAPVPTQLGRAIQHPWGVYS